MASAKTLSVGASWLLMTMSFQSRNIPHGVTTRERGELPRAKATSGPTAIEPSANRRNHKQFQLCMGSQFCSERRAKTTLFRESRVSLRSRRLRSLGVIVANLPPQRVRRKSERGWASIAGAAVRERARSARRPVEFAGELLWRRGAPEAASSPSVDGS